MLMEAAGVAGLEGVAVVEVVPCNAVFTFFTIKNYY